MALARKTTAARDRVRKHVNILIAAAITTTPVVDSCGFGVVDPIPPPASCPGLVGQLVISAKWAADANGAYIEVQIDPPAGRTDVAFTTNVTVQQGTLLSSQAGQSLVLHVAPVTGGASSVTVDFDVTCAADKSNGPTTGILTLTLGPTTSPGTAVMTSVQEQG